MTEIFKIAKWGSISIVVLALISCGDNSSISPGWESNPHESYLNGF